MRSSREQCLIKREGGIEIATIIIEELICCMQTHDRPQILRAVATGFSHHVTQRAYYHQSVFEDKMISGDI